MPFGVSYLELLANARGHSLIFALLTYEGLSLVLGRGR